MDTVPVVIRKTVRVEILFNLVDLDTVRCSADVSANVHIAKLWRWHVTWWIRKARVDLPTKTRTGRTGISVYSISTVAVGVTQSNRTWMYSQIGRACCFVGISYYRVFCLCGLNYLIRTNCPQCIDSDGLCRTTRCSDTQCHWFSCASRNEQEPYFSGGWWWWTIISGCWLVPDTLTARKGQ